MGIIVVAVMVMIRGSIAARPGPETPGASLCCWGFSRTSVALGFGGFEALVFEGSGIWGVGLRVGQL